MKVLYITPVVKTYQMDQSAFICASEGATQDYASQDIWEYGFDLE